jgi:hypothetical protein
MVDQRHVAGDHAGILERLDAPQAGRGREVDALRKLEIGEPPFGLQCGQDGPVYRIKLHFAGWFSHRMPSAAESVE